ncbi:MAG: DUF881 domain-containing protein [Ornithinibacter sp.]
MSRTQAPERRPDASMSLLTTMLERPLDPGYAASADRRQALGMARSTSLRSPRLVAATLLMGLMVGVSAYNLRSDTTPRSKARADLITQIEDRRDQVDAMAVRAQTLQAAVTAAQEAQLGDRYLVARSVALATVAGGVPLQGPGFTLTLDDAPNINGEDPTATDAGAADPQGRVVAKDLQFVTNELWASGAEAVSINDKRLTATSAIRFAGSAIIVDYRPLTRPYVITALGNPAGFPTTFADGPGGTYLSTLKSTFGIRVDTEVRRDLSVPAAVGLTLRYATTGDTERITPVPGSPPDSQEGPP